MGHFWLPGICFEEKSEIWKHNSILARSSQKEGDGSNFQFSTLRDTICFCSTHMSSFTIIRGTASIRTFVSSLRPGGRIFCLKRIILDHGIGIFATSCYLALLINSKFKAFVRIYEYTFVCLYYRDTRRAQTLFEKNSRFCHFAKSWLRPPPAKNAFFKYSQENDFSIEIEVLNSRHFRSFVIQILRHIIAILHPSTSSSNILYFVRNRNSKHCFQSVHTVCSIFG